MAKLIFEDRSYIEIIKSLATNKIIISIVARNENDSKSITASSVEITEEQFNELIKLK